MAGAGAGEISRLAGGLLLAVRLVGARMTAGRQVERFFALASIVLRPEVVAAQEPKADKPREGE